MWIILLVIVLADIVYAILTQHQIKELRSKVFSLDTKNYRLSLEIETANNRMNNVQKKIDTLSEKMEEASEETINSERLFQEGLRNILNYGSGK